MYDKKDDKLLDDMDLQGKVASCIRTAADYIDESVSPLRAEATKYYYGKPFGNERSGRSGYISTDVRDTILGLMPPLMRIFAGVERVCEFTAVEPSDQMAAQQATEVVHQVFYKENNGFKVLYEAFKDALVRKTGIVKWWHEQFEEAKHYQYSGISEQELQLLLAEEGAEVVEMAYRAEDATAEMVQPQVDPATGMQMPPPPIPMVVDCEIKITKTHRKYCVACVPPEEFLIDQDARCVEEASFVAHRTEKTVSDLIAMGYDRELVETNAGSGDDEFEYNEEAEDRDITDYDTNPDEDDHKMVMYYECYMKYDTDDDGIDEMIKVCAIGSAYKIVAVEGVDEVPFAVFNPDPEPHTWIGLSEADKVMDIQRIKSDVTRGIMDSLAQSINPRTGFVQGQVNVEDLQNNEVGALVRMRAPGMIQPLDTPFVGQQAFPMVEYLDSVREQRTGVSRASQGLNPAAMQSTTRAAVNATVEAAKGRVELIARVFAEVGLARLFKGLLCMIVKHQDKPMIMRLQGQYVPVDPRVWNTSMDVEINTGLSASTNEERMQTLSLIAQKQEQILMQMGPNNPLVTLAQYRSTLAKMVELTGYKDASAFFTQLPPDFQMPEPPQEDPQAQAAQMLAQVEREKAQAKMQVDQAKMQADQQVANAKLMLEREKMQADMARKQLELELQAAKMEAELQIKQAQVVLQQLKDVKGQSDGEREGLKAEAEATEQQSQLAQAIATLGQLVAQSQAATQAAMMMPKKVVRDANGRVAGVEPGGVDG